jgi:hypothetical protein
VPVQQSSSRITREVEEAAARTEELFNSIADERTKFASWA